MERATSTARVRSATMFLRRRFSVSSSFMRALLSVCLTSSFQRHRRRQAVALLELEFGVSQRRACVVVGQSRSTQRLPEPTPSENEESIRHFLRDFAKRHPRWGWRRGHDALRDGGWRVNHKKVQRLWREENRELCRRNRVLEQEVEILRRATAYFAKDLAPK